jgi:hypothetical protein
MKRYYAATGTPKCVIPDAEKYHISRAIGDAFINSGRREKCSSVAGRILELRGEAEWLQADLSHIHAVLRV